jgi:hypothetical protein
VGGEGWRTEERPDESRVKEERNWQTRASSHIMDRHELVRNAVAFLSDPSVGFCFHFLVYSVSNISCPVAELIPCTEDSVSRGERSDPS